jgi:hydroxymethylglutaryl-CoA lyase
MLAGYAAGADDAGQVNSGACAVAPVSVLVSEVGTRDGFQMEPAFIPTADKVAVLRALIAAGVRRLEVSSFVSPRAVPQLADAGDVLKALGRPDGVTLACLVPNEKGAARAADFAIDEMVAFVSASESHNRANVNRSIAQSLDGFARIAEIAAGAGIAVHGAIATSFGCPFEGDVPPEQVVAIARRFAALGVREVTLGDTTGMATPPVVCRVVGALRAALPRLRLTLHFHNTRGIGLVNVAAALELGIDSYEASIGGLGGCPFAPGASGNICTEDLVYMLEESGIGTGIDLGSLITVAASVQRLVGRELPGQVMKAGVRLRRFDLADARVAVG